MSSPNHPTSNIKDAFSSNFLDYILASSNYVPASPKTFFEYFDNSSGLVPVASPTLSLFHNDPYIKVMHAYFTKESPIPPPVIVTPSPMLSLMFNPQELFLSEELLPPKYRGCDRLSSYTSALPQEFKIGESSCKTSFERHKEQIEEIVNHLDELSLSRIENIEDIYAAVDSCETAQKIWLRVQQMMKGFDIGIQEKKAKLFNEWEREDFQQSEKEVDELKAKRLAKIQDPLALMANSNNPYAFPAPHQNQSSFNQNYLQQPMPNPEDITDPTTAKNMALALMAKAFKLNYSTPTNNNQRISSNPTNRQISKPGMNMRQDRQMQMVGGNGNQNQIGTGNLVAARAEENGAGQNGNQIRCYNYGGVGHYARNCTVRPRRRDAAYLQTQLLIAQKEEAGIQLQAKEYDLMAPAADLDEIEEVDANCILMANLQQASTSGTQTDSALVYDIDGSAEVHENCDDNEIFNMFTQEAQYTELLESILESHQVSQNDNDVISEDTSVEQGRETVEQHPVNFEETRALYESLYQNLAIEVEKVNSPNSFYHTEQKIALGYQNPFYLKQAQKKQQSLYDGKLLLEKHDPPVVHDLEETLQLAQESRDKMKQMNKEIKLANYTKINHLSGVFVPQTALSREELFFPNNSKTAIVSKPFSIPNEDLSDDTIPSVARKFLNEASSAHQELHKIIRDEIFPIVNQVDARLQNFEIQFLKKAAKFVGDFKSLTNEADASLAKYKALELEIKHLLKTIVSQDIMIIVQNKSVVDTSDLQTKLERTKEHFENYIIKKEIEYAKLWNDWYKKCDECKYDKISYDKAYKDMQQKIKRLQV
nr:hypothetical protein [Tanacetum cinerariifolium]